MCKGHERSAEGTSRPGPATLLDVDGELLMSTQESVQSPESSQVDLTPSEQVGKKCGRPMDDLHKYMVGSDKRSFKVQALWAGRR